MTAADQIVRIAKIVLAMEGRPHMGRELPLLVQTMVISAITVPTMLFVIAPALRGRRGGRNH